MPRGIVRFFNLAKEYGFIDPIGSDDDNKGVFVHKSELTKAGIPDLQEGADIEYTLTKASEHGKSKYDVASDLQLEDPDVTTPT